MANNRVYTESVVTLNNQEAMARMEELNNKSAELKKKMAEVRAEMARLSQEKGIDSKEFKAAQKELLALNKELNSVEKSQENINKDMERFAKIMNDLNGSNLNQLSSAAKTLYQQLRKLKPGTEEFIATSKKLKEVRTRMREIESQAGQTQKMFGGFFKKIGWVGLLTGALAAFKKFGSDMISQTQRVGDRWKAETSGWKSMYESFVKSIGSPEGWKDLIKNMTDAYTAGKNLYYALDELTEMNNALRLKQADASLAIEEANQKMRDTTLSASERKKAANDLISEYEKLGAEEQKVADRRKKIWTDELERKTKMSESDRNFFIKGYNDNILLIEQAKEYAQALRDRETYEIAAANATKNMTAWSGKAWETAIARQEEYNEKAREYGEIIAKVTPEVKKAYDIMMKYGEGNDELIENWLQAETAASTVQAKVTANTRKAINTRNQMVKQMSADAQNAANKAYQDEINASNARFQELQNQAKKSYADGEITYEQYQARLTEIQRQSLEDRLKIAEKHKQSTVELQSQLLDLAVQDKQKLDKLMDDLQKDAAKALEDSIKDMDKAIDEWMKEMDAEMQAFIDEWTEMTERANEIRRELNPVEALKEDQEAELSELDSLHEAGLLKDEEFEKKKLEIAKRYAKEITAAQLQPYEKGVEAAQGFINQVSDFVSKAQEAAAANLEAQMQAELTAAGDNAEKREQIEQEYEQKQLDLKKQYADVDMGINIAKTVANGAVAAIKAFADLGPIAGAIAAAIVAATTVAEIAVIVAQRNAIKNTSISSSGSAQPKTGQRVVAGYSEGGYTDRGSNDFQPVGVVHANEWVAPAAMVRANPVMFASLEQMRQSGNYHSGVSGYADGGTVAEDQATIAGAGNVDNQLLQRVYDIMAKIEASLPLKAYTVLSDLNAKQELDATIKSIAGKKS